MDTELSPKAAEIVACARALLAAGGYNGFSYADISAAVNISKPSVHHHFASKAELVRVVLVRYREEIRAGVAALEQQTSDPVAQLQAYTAYWTACIRDGSLPFCVCAMLAAAFELFEHIQSRKVQRLARSPSAIRRCTIRINWSVVVNRQYRRKHATSTVRAGSLILAPAEGGLETSRRAYSLIHWNPRTVQATCW